ncbi:hypothetical protein Efla_004327 [Eimeria flavescens]
MDLRDPIAQPKRSAPLGCRICGCRLTDRNEFNEHYRAPWHLYNMRRHSQQLPAVSFPDFQRKVELLQLARQYVEGEGLPEGGFQSATQEGSSESVSGLTGAAAAFHAAVRCNKRGTGHLKRQPQQQGAASSTASKDAAAEGKLADSQAGGKAAAAKAATAAWRAALQQHPERCNLFEQMPAFASPQQNLEFMHKAYGFFIPDEEYCTNPAGLLRYLWRTQQRQPRCLFCGRHFRGIRAALQHMQHQRHFQLRWDEEQQDLLARFYDYKKSYYELMERLPCSDGRQLTAAEAPSAMESDAPAATGASDTDEEEDDWEDCSSDEGESEAAEQQKLEAMLQARGWRSARVTEDGLLQLPNGHEVVHRAYAVYCRQRLRQMQPSRAEQCILQDLRGPSVHGASSRGSASLLRKKQKLLMYVGAETGMLKWRQQQRRLLLLPQQHRLIRQRQSEQQRKLQSERMKVSIKANKLQRVMLRETKCFL